MQPSEPTTPSSVPSEPVVSRDAAQPETRSAEDRSASPNLFERLFGRRSKSEGGTDGQTAQDAQPTEHPSPKTLTLTEDEIDRKVQAETDRREAKRRKDAAAQAEIDRRTAIERKLDPAAPEYDPYAGTEEQARLKAEEASAAAYQQQWRGVVHETGAHHDTVTLDVITAAVPNADLERIFQMEGAGVGLDGRKLIMAESLKALEKHWRAEGAKDAEAKLRVNSIFRKQVFAEHRGSIEEPELLPAGGSNGKADFMDQVFADYRAVKGRKR